MLTAWHDTDVIFFPKQDSTQGYITTIIHPEEWCVFKRKKKVSATL